MASLLLDYQPLALNLVDLRILVLQLALDRLLLSLQVFDFFVELVKFHLLPLDFLVVIRELLAALLFLPFYFLELLLCIEKVVLGFSEVFFGNPALPLLVTLLADKVLEVSLLVAQLLLHLTVSVGNPVHLLLKHLPLVCLVLDHPFHLIDFLLPLADVVLQLIHLLVEVVHRTLCEVYFAVDLFDAVHEGLDDQRLRFSFVRVDVASLHVPLLIFSVLLLQV